MHQQQQKNEAIALHRKIETLTPSGQNAFRAIWTWGSIHYILKYEAIVYHFLCTSLLQSHFSF